MNWCTVNVSILCAIDDYVKQDMMLLVAVIGRLSRLFKQFSLELAQGLCKLNVFVYLRFVKLL